MSITITKESDGILVVTIAGVLAYEELKKAENSDLGIKNPDQKAKILILAGKFAGWGKEGDWGDLSFMYEHDPYIEKIAVVIDEEWRDQLLMFLGAGRRLASVESFYSDEEEDAREWLLEEDE